MMTVAERSVKLRADMSMATLYSIVFADGEKIAARYLSDGLEKTITWNQYKERTLACASMLRRELGEGCRGSFIALQADTCPEWLQLYWGIITAGCNALLIDFSLNDEKTAYLLEQAGASVLITAKKRFLPGVKQFLLTDLVNAPADGNYRPVFGTMTAMCTSGTTSTSRIFVFDEKALCAQALNSELISRQNSRIIGETPGRNLAFLPLHHVFGFMVSMIWMSFLNFENIYLKDRAPKTIRETACSMGITHLMSVPVLAASLVSALEKQVAKESPARQTIFRAMTKVSLAIQKVAPRFGLDFARKVLFKSITSQMLGTDLQVIVLGGAHTPENHMKTLSALGYMTVAGFGMTETGVTSVETADSLGIRTTGSVGCPLDSAEYKVIPSGSDPQVGEMLIRGATVHTARLVDGQLIGSAADADGWYHTGDIVRLAKGSRMYVEGRAKEVIINESGENVYPDEVEEAFAGITGPQQISVLGVAKKGEKLREDVALVLNMGNQWQDMNALGSVSAQIRKINNSLPAVKRLTRVISTPDAFETANGIKVKRAALKKELESGSRRIMDVDYKRLQGTEPAPAAEEKQDELAELRARIRAMYAETLSLKEDEIAYDAHFIDDLGGDSLQVLGMSLEIEEHFGVTIPVEDFGQCVTINDLAAYLNERLKGGSGQSQKADKPVTPITRFEDSPEYIAFAKRQADLMGEGQENPYFVCHDSPLMDTSNMAGQQVLNFGSYNYVGMSGRPETKEAAKAAIDKYGTSASGSRLLAGEKSLYQELEQEIADWKHTETSLVLVGGHSTNVTCVGNFCGKGDLIVYDALAHNSIEQGCRLSKAASRPFPHNDVEALESILKMQRHNYGKVLIVIEGAYSMDGDIAPVPEIVAVKKKYGCFLMVDEAHSACVIGQTGGGVDEYFGLEPNDVDIKMGTLSKGLGACGGYLAGSRAIIDYMRYNLPGFVFSVGISPPLAAEVLCAIRLLRGGDPTIMANMRRNIMCFVEEAHKRHFNTCLAGETAIIPVLVGKDEDAFLLSNMLRKKGVFVPPAVYPAVPKNKARLRFCVISEHKPEQIVEALDKLAEAAAEAGIKLPE